MKFERRRMVIRSLNSKDVEDFCYQGEGFGQLSKTEKKLKINKMRQIIKKYPNDISSKLMLAVEEKDTGKLIGFIDIRREDEPEVLSIQVLIPNQQKLIKYGADVIDQFKKVCRDNWQSVKMLKLNRNCEAAKMYLQQHEIDTDYITVA